MSEEKKPIQKQVKKKAAPKKRVSRAKKAADKE